MTLRYCDKGWYFERFDYISQFFGTESEALRAKEYRRLTWERVVGGR